MANVIDYISSPRTRTMWLLNKSDQIHQKHDSNHFADLKNNRFKNQRNSFWRWLISINSLRHYLEIFSLALFDLKVAVRKSRKKYFSNSING